MRITISVPKPCHENWEAMSPRQQGRHCDQCDHVVADLTRATDRELVALFTSDAKPKCARFDPAQLDRALGAAEPRQSSMLPLAAFTSLVAVAAGQEAIAQGGPVVRPAFMKGEPAITRPAPPPPVLKGKVMAVPHSIPPVCNAPITGDTILMVEPDPIIQRIQTGQAMIEVDGIVARPIVTPPSTTTVELCGTVVDDRTGEPLPFVPVALRDHDLRTATDAAGNFKLQVPARVAQDLVVLDMRLPDYEALSKEVFPANPAGVEEHLDVPVSGPIEGEAEVINGFVTEVPKGAMLPGTLVRIKGTEVQLRCDDRGYFGLRVPAELVGTEVTLEFIHPVAGSMVLPVLTNRLPLYLPLKFTGHTHEPVPVNADGCREVGVLRMQRHYERFTSRVGGAVVCVVKEPNFWERLTLPFTRGR